MNKIEENKQESFGSEDSESDVPSYHEKNNPRADYDIENDEDEDDDQIGPSINFQEKPISEEVGINYLII
jgi:hypothetical protein